MSSVFRIRPRSLVANTQAHLYPASQRRAYAKQVPLPPHSEDDLNPNIKTFSSPSRPPVTSAPWMLNSYGEHARAYLSRRSFATEHDHKQAPVHWPPPPPNASGKGNPVTKTFESTSKPRPYYGRPPPRSDLPLQKKHWPLIVAFISAGVVSWGLFLLVVTNQEKLSSSVVRQIMRTVKDDADLKELLGEAIRPVPEWWLNGDPWIEGAINMMQGNIDVSFRLKGHKGSGTLYFTSVRKSKGEPFTILRFRVRGDDGTVVNVPPANYAS